MAVFTQLTHEQLQSFFNAHFQVDVTNIQPISAGTENSNYKVSLSRSIDDCVEVVLTLFEQISLEQVAPYIDLAEHLQQVNLAVPAPLADINGFYLLSLLDKPAIVCPFVAGRAPTQTTAAQCHAIGQALANIHCSSFEHDSIEKQDLLSWMEHNASLVFEALSDEQQAILGSELACYQQHETDLNALPQGIIHSDLFRDNTLFDQDKLKAILDFYSACDGFFLFDICVCINDWCFNDNNQFDSALMQSLLDGYQTIRSLSDSENKLLPLMLRMSACRFWISRLILNKQNQAHQLSVLAEKHPSVFEQRLMFLINLENK